ncbi:sulfur carrier protein ThiS [Acetobacterium malicum]|uniref:Sulfur carrier protein ThiS n=1 Tax=Acetobacterium malicum TaxID=52692 RepID=A0ABR6YZ46_9FIRM|nr:MULTISPECIES: sulfur carrier protein ThiS [Acetobacterium]MBC3900492.1 sulfur carrier protein ThiS [Acetobacterium malicum]
MRVNGKEMTLGNCQNLLQFLEVNQFDVATLAVARNGEIIPKPTYDTVVLCEEDTLEVVRFVGGG